MYTRSGKGATPLPPACALIDFGEATTQTEACLLQETSGTSSIPKHGQPSLMELLTHQGGKRSFVCGCHCSWAASSWPRPLSGWHWVPQLLAGWSHHSRRGHTQFHVTWGIFQDGSLRGLRHADKSLVWDDGKRYEAWIYPRGGHVGQVMQSLPASDTSPVEERQSFSAQGVCRSRYHQ